MKAKQSTIAILVLVMSAILSGCGPGKLAGIETPITVSGAQLQIVTATNDPSVYSTGSLGVSTSSSNDTVLYVEAELISGDLDLGTFADSISLTDESGTNCSLIGSGVDEPFWLFIVPKSSQSFTLHFGDEQTIILDSILQMIP